MSGKSDKVKIDSYDRYEFRGVKIAHELMVDILGGLIPGALFLFSIILCIVFPIICYADPNNNNFGFLVKDGDWFWIVAFLSFLILSYVIGHIFYRADIKMPDRADIRREQGKKLKSFVEGLPVDEDAADKKKHLNQEDADNKNDVIDKSQIYEARRMRYAATLLYGELKPLVDALTNNEVELADPYNNSYKKHCEQAMTYLEKIIDTPGDFYSQFFIKENDKNGNKEFAQFRKDILYVLFPETDENIKKTAKTNAEEKEYRTIFPNNSRSEDLYRLAESLFPEIDYLPFRSRSVLYDSVKIVPLVASFTKKHRWGYWGRLKFDINLDRINNNRYIIRVPINEEIKYESFNVLMVAYLILHMQNESGCATEKRCDFPYMSYYKYLLKRGLFQLLKYADWNTAAARTKNRINKYKIELQLNVPEAYSIINKNESHIRMASSAWHVARTIQCLSWIMIVVMGILACLAGIYHHNVTIIAPQTEQTISHHNHHDNENGISSKSKQRSISQTYISDDFRKIKKGANMKYVYFIEKYMTFIVRETMTHCYLAVIFPIISLLLALYILRNVPRFIHYQRLREIYYTLKVYKLWEDAMAERDKKEKIELDIRRAEVNLPPIDNKDTAG